MNYELEKKIRQQRNQEEAVEFFMGTVVFILLVCATICSVLGTIKFLFFMFGG